MEEEEKTVNLKLNTQLSQPRGVVQAARVELEKKEDSPESAHYSDDDVENLRAEREKMLQLIKNNQKIKMEEMSTK